MSNSTVSFSDIFKSSFLSKAVESFSLVDMLLTMLISILLGFLIYFVYKKSYNGVMYSHSFNTSLVSISAITALVIMAVTANVVLSLGMVGALSIVRFRTAVKDPMDIVYLFWSFAVGIVTGAGFYLIALIGSIVIAIVVYNLSRIKSKNDPYLLIADISKLSLEEKINGALKDSGVRSNLKSKVIRPDGSCELTLEVRVSDETSKVLNTIAGFEGVSNAVLVSYNGEFTS